ncbi:MAG: TetR/AcrR family transcriptional regulator, partial [Firmicutes bacterium]|nr:TetR/AcrR family transcriptional regulator [Bacillota bacterium]
MARKNDVANTKKRILQVCVRLFLEKGYHKAVTGQILKAAKVSCSSFQNLFTSKEGVLLELVKFMYENQFGVAGSITGSELPPVYVYATETAIQLT